MTTEIFTIDDSWALRAVSARQIRAAESDCEEKTCGDDGCGGSCGTCDESTHCDLEGQCVNPASCVNRCEPHPRL